jgi:nucleoside-diphosphate-sugar epimerase
VRDQREIDVRVVAETLSKNASPRRAKAPGVRPWARRKARLNAASERYPTRSAIRDSDNEPSRTSRAARRATAPLDVRSRGTANVIDAMRATGTRRLIVQSTYGIGETYANVPLSLKAFFTFVIRPQVTDHVRQEELVRESGLDWTVVRPVVLEDTETDTSPRVDLEDRVDSMKVSRTQLARVLAQAVDRDDWQGRTLSVSA